MPCSILTSKPWSPADPRPLHKRLKAARLAASHDQEMRKLIGVDLLIIDDFALTALGVQETAETSANSWSSATARRPRC